MSSIIDRNIQKVFGPKGILSRQIEGYEDRPQQARMATEVCNALVSDENLIIEAPTGTGKTLAYLVAAALSRKKIAVSTGTKNLQEQLFLRDIPFLVSKVFPKLRTALLKGRSNFICHSRLHHFLKQPYLQGSESERHFNDILDWYNKTKEYGSGDRAELENLPDDDSVWSEICSTTETCLGKKCRFREDCFVMRMRAKAQDSDIMVVNHHLLCSDLAIKGTGYGEVIPNYEALIVDEAHGLEDAATQHFGLHLGPFKVLRLIKDAKTELARTTMNPDKYLKALDNIDIQSRRLFDELASHNGSRAETLTLTASHLEAQTTICTNLDVLASMIANYSAASDELKQIGVKTSAISTDFKIILDPEPAGDYACWVEKRDRYVQLHASPIEVADKLKTVLYEALQALVFTSATLSAGGNFNYFKSRLGVPNETQELILDTPFNYSDQTLLYVPRSAPNVSDEHYGELLTPLIKEILEKTSGRAFVLFTSYKNLEIANKILSNNLRFPLLVQGAKPKTKLLEEFRSTPGCVLLATSSFWEGVDVRGEALSCVIVDRLPFAVPTDPIIAARIAKLKSQGKEPFYSLQAPMAVIALKQGLGRLIRTRSDRGILAVMDTRILTKSYGKLFLKSLYDAPICRDISDIERFFSQPELPIHSPPDRANPQFGSVYRRRPKIK